MSPQQGPCRARIAFSDSAAKQLENITSEAGIHALDRALVVISVDPDVGEPIPGDTAGPQLRQYTDEVEAVRVLYFVTALRPPVISGCGAFSAGQVDLAA
ncbi:hypothetical protein PV726_43875 [Streptomyces europaeiscabiei]|uniref:hypothetical protein n=1 Tax=Streptomyces europaeiscabiei TaxID=146819 RepID=UPI0029B447EC|nr:hypothetical protein [Streptomyces europaeiscabiei]MDX3697058.1 hypothetical protein [Streptomyces europaeiscabiei]